MRLCASRGRFLDTKRKSPGVTSAEALPVSGDPQTSCGPAETYDGIDYTAGLTEIQEELEENFVPKKKMSGKLSRVYRSLANSDPLLLGGSLHGRADRTHDCGSFLEFCAGDSDPHFKLHQANFCRDRLCPMCNWRRSLKIFHQVSQVMDKLEPDGYRYIMLTLTVRNCQPDELSDTIDMMQAGWRSLLRDSVPFRRSRRGFVIHGGVRVLEVTRNGDRTSPWYGTFHPHYHLILAVRLDYFTSPSYIDHAGWVSLWRNACGLNYDPSVFVEVIKPDPNAPGGRTMGAAVAEVAKYAVKSSDYLSSPSLDVCKGIVTDLLSGLTGRRLVSFFGCFFKARQELNLDDVESGDLVVVDGEQLRDDVFQVIVRCHWRVGFYQVLVYTSDDE